MRIISNFKDYYDIGSRYGFDPNVTYVREVRDGEGMHEAFSSKSPLMYGTLRNLTQPYSLRNGLLPGVWQYNDGIETQLFVIGFCGKLYNCMMLEYKGSRVFMYTQDDAVRILTERKLVSKYSWGYDSEKTIRSFYKNPFDEFKGYFEKYRVPIFVVEFVARNQNELLCLNRRLIDLDFAKIIHPVQAYQQIEMFYNSILVQREPCMVNISDKDMAVKKGFDKFSFRKEPQAA